MQSLRPAQRATVLQDYFDPVDGHGYTLCRVRMNSCDFALGNYAHVETPGDVDLAVLFTEGCQEGGPHTGEWALGERHARSMIADLNRWTVGWIDWNLLLDETGGPDQVGDYRSAPVLADTASGELVHQNSHAYIGHIARFVRPGARRVLCAATRQDIECTASPTPTAASPSWR